MKCGYRQLAGFNRAKIRISAVFQVRVRSGFGNGWCERSERRKGCLWQEIVLTKTGLDFIETLKNKTARAKRAPKRVFVPSGKS